MIPISLIWYDVEKFKDLDSPTFNSYEDLVLFTREFSSNGDALWCLDIESGASTGWIATNWLEDLILHQQGPEVYDKWASQELLSSADEITISILDIGKLIFIDNIDEETMVNDFFTFSPIVLGTIITCTTSLVKFKKYQEQMEEIYIVVDRCITMIARLKSKKAAINLIIEGEKIYNFKNC